jgi:hypothetical protein
MKIKTKFRIGQTTYFYLNNKPCVGVIKKIDIAITKNENNIICTLNSNFGTVEAVESLLFNSKEELLNSLKND